MCWWASDKEWCIVGFFFFRQCWTTYLQHTTTSKVHRRRICLAFFREVIRLTCWTWLNLCHWKVARSFCLNSRFVGPHFRVQNFSELEDSILELGVIEKLNISCRNVAFCVGVATCTAWHSISIMIGNKTGRQHSCNVFSLPSNRWRHCHSQIWLCYVRAALVAITFEWR